MTGDPVRVTGATGPHGGAVVRALGTLGYRADSAELRARLPEVSLTTFRDWVA